MPAALPTMRASAAARRISCDWEAPRGTQQGLVVSAAVGAGGDDCRAQECGQHGGGQPEKQKKDPGVGGVAAGGVERGAEVVTDARAAGADRFHVMRRCADLGVGRAGIAGQRLVERGVDLGVDEVGPLPPSGSNTVRHGGWSRITPLSGGATGCAPAGAPTFWNRESAWGTSTTPSTTTVTGGIAGRPIATLSPGATCRLAAVCWAVNTPWSAPSRVRIAAGNCWR